MGYVTSSKQQLMSDAETITQAMMPSSESTHEGFSPLALVTEAMVLRYPHLDVIEVFLSRSGKGSKFIFQLGSVFSCLSPPHLIERS